MPAYTCKHICLEGGQGGREDEANTHSKRRKKTNRKKWKGGEEERRQVEMEVGLLLYLLKQTLAVLTTE